MPAQGQEAVQDPWVDLTADVPSDADLWRLAQAAFAERRSGDPYCPTLEEFYQRLKRGEMVGSLPPAAQMPI